MKTLHKRKKDQTTSSRERLKTSRRASGMEQEKPDGNVSSEAANAPNAPRMVNGVNETENMDLDTAVAAISKANANVDKPDDEVTLEDDSQEDDDDEDDPVVHELPVFLSRGLESCLHLWQFPVRPAHMTYDQATVLASRVRTGRQQVELTVALDTATPNYDVSKGEQMAQNVDGTDAARAKAPSDPDALLYPSGMMDKQVLTSTKSVMNPDRYAVGILSRSELHITPLKSVLTLRPDLKYLDKSDKTARAEGRLMSADDPSLGGDDDAADGDLQQVTVRFAKGDTESAKKWRERSYEYQRRKAEEEPWVQTRMHAFKSEKWEEETQHLFCKKMDEEIVSLGQGDGDYLDALMKS